ALSLQGQPRQPAVIELVTGPEYLPSLPACADDDGPELCQEAIEVHWARALFSRRAHTCVLRWVEQVIGTETPAFPYAAGGGDLRVPEIPPLSEGASVTKAFGFGLT